MKSKFIGLCAAGVMAAISILNGQTTGTPQNSQPVVPRLVNFSGRAADANGKAVAGVTGVTFAIYRDQQGGAPLWIETQSVSADNKGNFTAQLGATKPEGLPLDLFTSGEARWLGVSLNGATEQPRVLLMSVPYALKAADAETVGGLPASAFVLAAPTVANGLSVPTAGTPTTVSGSVPPPATSNVTTTGGTVNALPLFTTATNIQNSILTQTGTTAINVAGKLNLPATAPATATAGKNSRPESLVASVFNSTTATAVPQTFQLQAEPAGNNTASASATLNLLFATGTNAPAETGLKIGSNGQITFATGQLFPGTGTITGVTTATGSGLTGGGTSGTLNLSLLSSCTANQILKWNGKAWTCAADANSGGTVKSVALIAPASDFTVTGSPITGSGTLALNWVVPPDANATPFSIVKRTNVGGISVDNVSAVTSGGYPPIVAQDISGATNVAGVSGSSTSGTGVQGQSTNGYGVSGISTSSYGVVGQSATGDGVYGNGPNAGVYGATSTTYGTGVFGSANGSNGIGVWGSGPTGILGTGTTGVNGSGNNEGVYGSGPIGVDAESTSGGGEGLLAYNSSNGDAILAGVAQSSGYAAYFNGTVDVNGTLIKAGGSFKIDHPLDPANKYLSHSFVESPDMKDIYDGVATLDAKGETVIEMPDWFGALNRDFRYQLTAIGAPGPNLYVAEEISGNHFKIAGGTPGMRVSWQVTGIRQDAWANAHRIPVEEEKPEAERGSYMHPELYGADEDQSLVWRRHPETWKHLKERAAKANAASRP